jgi:transglutaminase-like putative cysteine protease
MQRSADLGASRITINVLNKRLATLFYPDAYFLLNTESVPLTNGFSFETEELLPAYGEYSFDFLSVDWNDPDMAAALKDSKRGYYDELARELGYIREYYNEEFDEAPGFLYDYSYSGFLADADFDEYYSDIDLAEALSVLAASSEMYYGKYTQLPDNITDRTRQLVAEISGGLDNDYDKAKAIQSYLSRFEYTLSPGETPLESEFVDHFIFEQEKGYCVHFATAFSVMSRLAGIPSRYCEGYIVPGSASGDVYTITNMQAHAWTELYFEGVGWVRFEPTPGGAVSQVADTADRERPYPAIVDEPFSDELSLPENRDRFSAPEVSAPEPADVPVNWSVIIGAGLFVLFGLAFVMAGAGLASILIRPKLISDRRDLAKFLYARLTVLMRKVSRPMRRDETAVSYAADYLKSRSVYYGQDKLLLAAEVYSKAEYGLDEVSEEELEIVKEAFESVKGKVIFAYGRPRYWLTVMFER